MNKQPFADEQAFPDLFTAFRTMVEVSSDDADAMNRAKQVLAGEPFEMTAGMADTFLAMSKVFVRLGGRIAVARQEGREFPDEMLESIMGFFVAAAHHLPALDEAVDMVDATMARIGF